MGVKPDVLCPQSPCERAGWRGHRGPPACGVDVSCPRALFVQGKGGQGRLGSTFYELCPLITGEVNAHSGLPGSPPSAGKARPREWRTCPSSPDSPTDVGGGRIPAQLWSLSSAHRAGPAQAGRDITRDLRLEEASSSALPKQARGRQARPGWGRPGLTGDSSVAGLGFHFSPAQMESDRAGAA